MKSKHITYLIVLIVVCRFIYCSKTSFSKIVTYPPIPGLETSEIFKVIVNGQSIWTEKLKSQMDINTLPDWFVSEPYTKKQQELHIANFSCFGAMEVVVELSVPITKATVKPNSRAIQVEIDNNRLSFNCPGAAKLYIEVNDLPPLCFFANPLEKEFADKNNPRVRYFGPGVHRPGVMTLSDSETVYIDGGAIVYGGLRVDSCSAVQVMGRGILDGDFKHQRMVRMRDSQNIKVNGIMIRNGRTWTNTLINCKDVVYSDVKVLSFGPGGDGINPLGSQNVTIDNCFLRCTDDCIAIKSPDSNHVVKNVRVLNNTMIGFAFSDGVTIGFETNGPSVSDVLVNNCDILQARGGSRVDGHSAFSIICDGPADIFDIRYEDIRIDRDVLKLFELDITDGTKYGVNPPGHIHDIYLKNITWDSERPIILKGYDKDHIVKNVTFDKCTIAKKLLNDTTDLFETNEFVEDVWFK